MTATVTILEGADGTGKSTRARRQATYQPTTVIHNGPPVSPNERLYALYRLQIERAIERRDKHGESTIIDRSFLSEYIYGPHRKGGSLITKHQVQKLERFCKRHGVNLVGISAPIDVRKARIKARGEKWIPLYAFTGAAYDHYFQEREAYWIHVNSLSTPE